MSKNPKQERIKNVLTRAGDNWRILRVMAGLEAVAVVLPGDSTKTRTLDEQDRRRILRAHEDTATVSDLPPDVKGQSPARPESYDGKSISELRREVDEALYKLCLIELGYQTGILAGSRDAALYKEPLNELCKWASFLRYLNAYLYFSIRFLGGRCFPPDWVQPEDQWKLSRPRHTRLDSDPNKQRLQLPVTPAPDSRSSSDEFLMMGEFLSLPLNTPDIKAALRFLDDFLLPERK